MIINDTKERKTMKNIFLIILTISTLKVAGQNHLFGVKCGSNLTNITSSNTLIQNGSRIGLTTGLTYKFLFKKLFSIGADLIYNQRGFTYEIEFADNFGNLTGEKYTSKFNYNYISLPIKTGLNIGAKFYGFINIGVIPSILVNAKTTIPTIDTDGKLKGIETMDMTSNVSKFDFAELYEIGGGYKFKNRFWLFTSVESQNSITTIKNSGYFENIKIRHNGITLTIGIKCELTKE